MSIWSIWRMTGLDAEISAKRFWSDLSHGVVFWMQVGRENMKGKRTDLGNRQDTDPREYTRCLCKTKEAIFLAKGPVDRGTPEARNPEGAAGKEDHKFNFGYFSVKSSSGVRWIALELGWGWGNPGKCQRLGNHPHSHCIKIREHKNSTSKL